MRGILVLIGLIALAVVVLMSVGMLRIEQQQGATMPTITFDAKGGQLPKFKAETGSVGIGSLMRWSSSLRQVLRRRSVVSSARPSATHASP